MHKSEVTFFLTIAFSVLTLLAAWFTHIVWIIGKIADAAGATVGQMVLGIVGAFMPPVGIIHGFMIWFGHGT